VRDERVLPLAEGRAQDDRAARARRLAGCAIAARSREGARADLVVFDAKARGRPGHLRGPATATPVGIEQVHRPTAASSSRTASTPASLPGKVLTPPLKIGHVFPDLLRGLGNPRRRSRTACA